MLYLLFQLGADRYAIAAGEVVRVLPLVELRAIPHAPEGVAGIFDYGGRPVPALDLSRLLLGRPAQARMSTRIVLVRQPDAAGAEHLLGLIAEHATDTVRLEPAAFAPSGVRSQAAPYLGDVSTSGSRLVQRIDLQQLLPAAVRAALFAAPVAA
ncbi:MAG: chemotaxis protein CheW [Nevskia sp.]|nr:chemotaxis protein CheW [Nevskia sp.]